MKKPSLEQLIMSDEEMPDDLVHFEERWEEIRDLHRRRGLSLRKMYKVLHKRGELNMSLSTFYKLVSRRFRLESNLQQQNDRTPSSGDGNRYDLPVFPRKSRDPSKF